MKTLVAILVVALVAFGAGLALDVQCDKDVEAQTSVVPLAQGLQVEEGGWHGSSEAGFPAPTMRFDLGSIEGLRDAQFGKVEPGDGRFNAGDIGAGNAAQPGRLGIGADVTGTIVYHARQPSPSPPVLLATMTPDGTTFHAPVSFESGVYGLPITETAIRRIARQAVRQHLRNHH